MKKRILIFEKFEDCYIDYEAYYQIIERIMNEKHDFEINHVWGKVRIDNNVN